MSQWLKSVANVLDQLDDTTGTTAAAVAQRTKAPNQAVQGLLKRVGDVAQDVAASGRETLLGGNNTAGSGESSDEYYTEEEGDEYFTEDEDDYYSEDGDVEGSGRGGSEEIANDQEGRYDDSEENANANYVKDGVDKGGAEEVIELAKTAAEAVGSGSKTSSAPPFSEAAQQQTPSLQLQPQQQQKAPIPVAATNAQTAAALKDTTVAITSGEEQGSSSVLSAPGASSSLPAVTANDPLSSIPPPQSTSNTKKSQSLPPPPTASSGNSKLRAIGSAPSSNKSNDRTGSNNKLHQRSVQQVQALKEQLKKSHQETQTLKEQLKQSQQELLRVQKQESDASAQLEAVQAEMLAQQDELQAAADRMQEDRENAKEDRLDMEEDHEEEVLQLKEEHQDELASQKKDYEEKLKGLRDQLQQQKKERKQEGGDWTKELREATEREQNALARLSEAHGSELVLKGEVSELEAQQVALQTQVQQLSGANEAATERERAAEEKLDRSNAVHKQQLQQRQQREQELEQTVAELGAALAAARRESTAEATASAASAAASSVAFTATVAGEGTSELSSYRDKYQLVSEELESLKQQNALSTQRSDALQRELTELTQERSSEAAAIQQRQKEHDRQVARLTAQVSKLQQQQQKQQQGENDNESFGSSGEMGELKRQIAKVTDQLVRQQGLAEHSKSEVLALKGRLQTATTRAEIAEAELQQQNTASDDVESGMSYMGSASKIRRRVKGGRSYFGPSGRRQKRMDHLPSRSIRASLGLRALNSNRQVAATIDAIDSWMLDTSNIIRHEPLARIGFAIYLVVVHLWCFGLVFFHAVQSEEYGDLDHHKMGNAAAGVQQAVSSSVLTHPH